VEWVHIDVGTQVTKGDLILSLDSEKFRYAFEAARIKAESDSSVAVADAEVRMKRADLESKKQLQRYQRSGRELIDKGEAELAGAIAKLQLATEAQKLARLELKRAGDQLEARFIRSPINGVLVDLPKKRGETVAAGNIVAVVADPTALGASFQMTPELAATFENGGRIALRRAGGKGLEWATIRSIFALPGDAKGTQQMNVVFDDPSALQSAEYQIAPQPAENDPSKRP
jgi:multidrug efflux pump subunit AcrA (membrane-fusion protein)